MVRGLDERHIITGFDEARRSKLVMGVAWLRCEKIDIDEAACAAWVAQRDLRPLQQYEWAVAAIPDSLEERSNGEHGERRHSRFHR